MNLHVYVYQYNKAQKKKKQKTQNTKPRGSTKKSIYNSPRIASSITGIIKPLSLSLSQASVFRDTLFAIARRSSPNVAYTWPVRKQCRSRIRAFSTGKSSQTMRLYIYMYTRKKKTLSSATCIRCGSEKLTCNGE